MIKKIFIGLLLFVSLAQAQSVEDKIINLQNFNSQLKRFYNEEATSQEQIDIIKNEIKKVKVNLPKSTNDLDNVLYRRHFVSLDYNTELLDFYLYNYSTNYFQAFGRIKNLSGKYLDYVNLRCNFYKNDAFVGTDYSYIDLESAGSSGISPYQFALIDTYYDKVDFDSIAFEIDYNSSYSEDDILWDQVLIQESNVIRPSGSANTWQGQVVNNYNYSMKFPYIYACIFRYGHMVACDYTYLDVSDNTMNPYSRGTYDSYIELPSQYDEIKYYLSYSLYSLDGSGNLPPNRPIFKDKELNAEVRVPIDIKFYLDDPNSDQVNLSIDFGDGVSEEIPGEWSSSRTVTYGYSAAGEYVVTVKGYDNDGLETQIVAQSIEVTGSVNNPQLSSMFLDTLQYMNSTSITLLADGGFQPYLWEVISGNLPQGLTLNQNTGVLNGQPESSGHYDFTVLITDAGLPAAVDSLEYSLYVTNNCPILTSPDSLCAYVGETVTYTPAATDPDGNSVTYIYENYPSWMAVTNNLLLGVAPDTAFTDRFDVIANDGDMSDTLTVNLLITIPSDVSEESSGPIHFALHQNYPNPFNPETVIGYDIAIGTNARLSIFDMSGRRIKTLVDEILSPGSYQSIWHGTGSDGSKVPSGVYLFELRCGEKVFRRKGLLLK